MSMVAGDYPTLLQPPDALKRRSGTQTYCLPEVLERELTIGLQQHDDMSIDMIKLHTNNILILLYLENIISPKWIIRSARESRSGWKRF
jgi:hypothetical protein